MNTLTDLDFHSRRSWQGALDLIFALCGRAADLSFDMRTLGSCRLPTGEFRLDQPEKLRLPEITAWTGASAERWENGTVLLADTWPETVPDGDVWVLRRTGAAAVTYRAFRETVRVLAAVGLPSEFAWSSIPLAPVCDDASVTERAETLCYRCGAIHTLWLRCPSDEKVRTALGSLSGCGQLRVQNMATANTWISGRLDEERLKRELRLT